MSREDVSAIYGAGTVYVTCDAQGCSESVQGRPRLGTWFEGWVEDTRNTPLTTGSVRDYCLQHAALARPLSTR